MIRAPLLAGLCLMVGCGGGPEAADADLVLPWFEEPLFEIGGAGAPVWASFGSITGVSFDDTGRLWILDGDAARATRIETDGTPGPTVGGPGDGPDELTSAVGIVAHPDGSVTILDDVRRRLVTWGADGSFRGAVPLPPDVPAPAGPLALTADGRVLGTRDGRTEVGEGRPVVLHPVDTTSTAEVVVMGWPPPVPRNRPLTDEETGGFRVRLPPVVGFHPALLAAPLPDGLVAIVDSTDWRIERVGPDGRTAPPWTRPHLRPPRVTDALRDAERERLQALLEADPPRMMVSDGEGGAVGVADDAVSRLERARIDAMGFHEVVPVIERIGVDRQGRLWIQRSGDAPGQPGPTDVMGSDGLYLGTLPPDGPRLPDAFGPDGHMARVGADDLGAPVVRVSRLRAPDPNGSTPGG